jgi:hypothetical protein
MALRIIQVVVEVLRTSTCSNLAPAQANTTIFLHPAPSEVADFKQAATHTITFDCVPRLGRDALANVENSSD